MSLETGRSALEQRARDLLHRWYDAWNAHDVGAISALMTDDVAYEDPGATEPVTRGRAPVEAWARTAFRAVPDMHLELLEEWVSPGRRRHRLVLPLHRDRHRATGTARSRADQCSL